MWFQGNPSKHVFLSQNISDILSPVIVDWVHFDCDAISNVPSTTFTHQQDFCQQRPRAERSRTPKLFKIQKFMRGVGHRFPLCFPVVNLFHNYDTMTMRWLSNEREMWQTGDLFVIAYYSPLRAWSMTAWRSSSWIRTRSPRWKDLIFPESIHDLTVLGLIFRTAAASSIV